MSNQSSLKSTLENQEKIPQLLSVKQLSQIFPAFSELSLRWIIFNKKTNGAHVFVKKIGKRKIVIDSLKFKEWVENQTAL